MSAETAKRDGWQLKPFPQARATLPYTRSFDAAELEKVKRGLVPAAMEDKWFILFEEPWLYLHRSWSGIGIYAVKLRAEADGAVVEEAHANRDPAEFRETDDAHDARMLAFLIDRLLLGLSVEFPVRDGFDREKVPLLVHHVVGRYTSR
jgi:hypothetical protein